MNSNFSNFLTKQTESGKNKIAIMPFYDNSVGGPDSTLYYGIPFFIYDNFSISNKNFIYPYLSFSVLNSEGIAGEKLYTAEAAKKIANKLQTQYVIFGSFQRITDSNIRVLVNLFDAKSNQILSPAQEFSSNANDAFFDLLKTNVKIALKRGKWGDAGKDKTSSPSMDTFRYWSKGLELASSYNYTNLDLASLWFEKALKESFQKYEDAALHLARVYFMMATIQKLNKNDFSTNWKRGLETLNYIHSTPKKGSTKHLLTLRYVEAHKLSLNAGTAYMASDMHTAHNLATAGLKLVPEDGILQNLYLVTSQGKADNTININNPICF